MSAPAAQILVIRGGAIGDFIVTLPALAALRAQFPAVRIELVAYERVADLALRSGLVDGWRPIESRGLASFFARNGVLEPEWQDYFAAFPIIVSHLFDPDDLFKNNVAKSAKGQFIQSLHRPDEKTPVHATEQLLKPLERLAIFGADPEPKLTLPATVPARNIGSSRLLAIHPGSGSESKNWPLDHWKTLLARLVAERDDRFLVLAGEADQPRLEQILNVIPEARRKVIFQRPLVDVAMELAQADHFLGHDSGISHLAAALGLPGTVLWGPTHAEVWRPRSERFHLLRHPDGLAKLAPDTVLAAL